MLEKVLIANRGEIACRIIATCRRLGIATVAVYSEADAGARHTRLADEAVPIGPAPATESYLDVERLIGAARATGAQALHPGYGFLSENPELALQCADAGVVFIGPAAQTLARMGSKSEAKRLMGTAGVPVIPGYHGDDQGDATLHREAERVGFPLLVKASAGGGGKGMRVVEAPEDLAAAIEGARREARSAFGDDRLLLERYLRGPRHIEFQVFGDRDGRLIHLYERECSIQRRYQKIIEESPSPFLDDDLRERMGVAAVAAAGAVGYYNAGTVEFIVDDRRRFYFLEMNTRLQVEHPVTEMVTGLDLVEWQLRVAAGEALPASQEAIARRGHAVEARLYAEDPDEGFVPATGVIGRFAHPPTGPALRLDSGYEDGDAVSIHYDPMIAKLICHGEDRPAALAALRHALAHTAIFGPRNNLRLLRRIAADPAFAAGEADTGYIDAHLGELLEAPAAPPPVYAAAAVAEMRAREARVRDHVSPWALADGWRANGRSRNTLVYAHRGGPAVRLSIARRGDGYRLRRDDAEQTVQVTALDAERLALTMGDAQQTATVLAHGDGRHVAVDDRAWELTAVDPYAVERERRDDEAHPGSPMPGRIVAVHVAAGERVIKGQALLVLEGMKMEHTVRARADGVVERLHCRQGDMVDAEVPLIDIGAAAQDDAEPS